MSRWFFENRKKEKVYLKKQIAENIKKYECTYKRRIKFKGYVIL